MAYEYKNKKARNAYRRVYMRGYRLRRIAEGNPIKGKSQKGYLSPNQRKIFDLVLQKKSVPCADCGVLYPHYVMDLDHIPDRGKKEFALGVVRSRKKKMPEVIEELKKCEAVCSNCHRIRTHVRLRGQLPIV